MERAEISRRVDQILEDEFELDPTALDAEANLFEDLGLDSLDAVDLVAALEAEFGITIDRREAETEIRSIRILEEVYRFVEKKLEA